MSTFVPNEDAAPAIINFILFPMLFISGTFGPIEDDSGLARIADVFPVRHLNKLMEAVFNPFGGGTALVARHLAVLVGWGVLALVVGLRRFRWEPRGPDAGHPDRAGSAVDEATHELVAGHVDAVRRRRPPCRCHPRPSVAESTSRYGTESVVWVLSSTGVG